MPPNVSYLPSNTSSTNKIHRCFVPRVHIIREEVAIAHREKLVGEFVRGEIDERNYTVQYNYALEVRTFKILLIFRLLTCPK